MQEGSMNYATIGAGKEGQALAKAFARKQIEVAIASRRSPEALAPVAKAIGQTIIPESLRDAVKADTIILAIPFGTQKEVAKAAESWQGKIVIDVTNAYGVSPEELGNLPSSVVISQAFPGAKLVKAFNHSGSIKWSHRVREVRMRILTLAVLIAGFATLIAVPAGLQAQEPPKNIVTTPYIKSPLEGDPSREVRLTTVLVPAGGATPFHRHPGDQWEMVQEGEITYTVKGEEPKVLKAGDAVYIPRGTVHRNQNLSGQPVRTVELLIVDKDKPQTEPVN
jgi:predicted dinucleotide-binding enzyme/quercetin dioxygenase-like cupin family protein